MSPNPQGDAWSVWEDRDGTWRFFGSTPEAPPPTRRRFRAVGVALAVTALVAGLEQDRICASWWGLPVLAIWCTGLAALACRWSVDP